MVAARTPWWSWISPLFAWVILLATIFIGGSALANAAAGVALIATVYVAVYHAEVVAHRTGEPFGTLVLAVAVTIIEVALIVSIMVGAPEEKTGLARDTVFAAVMIVCNGIVGLCLLWGGARHHEQAPASIPLSACAPGPSRRLRPSSFGRPPGLRVAPTAPAVAFPRASRVDR